MRMKSNDQITWSKCVLWILVSIAGGTRVHAQSTFRYSYDDASQLKRVIDSSGNEVDYTYDAAGNLTQITRGAAPASGALAILSFTPQTGGAGANVTIQGQNFSTTAASNTVSFNGTAATVVSASATSIVATVPANATTGPISVKVGANTATSTNNFTFIAVPNLLSITPKSVISSTTATNIPALQVTGTNLTNSTFSFSPAFTPAAIAINSATIDPSGTSATLNVTVAAGASGTYTLLATNASGASSTIATSANALHVLSPNNDDDGDGLTNALEAALGTDPLNPQTSGAGLPDGWQVFYGLNPLNPAVASEDLDGSGLTVLQDYQMGLSPRNPNRVPPAVASTNPKNGATGVFINSALIVRFTEPLLTGIPLSAAQTAIGAALGSGTTVPVAAQQVAGSTLAAYMNRTCCGTSVIPGTVTLFGPDGAVNGGIAASNDSLSVTFSPTQQLSANTTYGIQVNGLRDAAGNLMTKAYTGSFTVGSALDTKVPTVIAVVPENNSSGVPVNARYSVLFSKSMDPSSLTPANFSIYNRTAGAVVAGMVQVNADGVSASFIPSGSLAVANNFQVTITTAIKDTDGNNLASSGTYYFSTGDGTETAAPHLLASSPSNGTTGVPLNALVDLLFSEPVDITSVLPNIRMTTTGVSVPVMIALSDGDQRLTITPAAALLPNVSYKVTVGGGIADLAGLALDNPGSFTFQTGSSADTTTPSVVAVDPANNSTGVPLNTLVRIGFSKPVAAATLGAGSVVLSPSGIYGVAPVPGTVSASSSGQSATFTASSSLQPETPYCVNINGVVDLEGHGLAQNGQNLSCFTTGTATVSTGPSVLAVNPANGATGVPVNTLIEVQLSEPVGVVSAGSSAITLSSSGGAKVAGALSLGVSGTTLTFTPEGFLSPNATYTVRVAGFTDLAGNEVTAFTSSFATASSALPINVSTGLDTAGNLITVGGTADGHWVVTPTSGTPPPGTFSASGTSQPLLVAAPGDGGFATGWPNNGPDSSWLTINPNSVTGNTFGVYSTTFKVPGSSVPGNLCLVGNMGVDDNGQLGINGQAIMGMASAITSLTPLNIPISNYLVPGVNTLSLGWGPTDNDYEGFRLQAVIENCGGSTSLGPLTVLSIAPGDGATGVAVTSPVVVTFNEAVNPLTVTNQSVVVQAYVQGAWDTVAGTYAVSGPGVTFTPLNPLPGGATVRVLVDDSVSVQDLAGNSGQYAGVTFTTAATADTTAPTVVSVTPMNKATGIGLNGQVVLTFSKSMNPATLKACCTTGNYSNVAVLAGETRVGFNPSVSADNRTLTLSGLNLPASTVMTVVVTHGATDLSGNALVDFSSRFTTGSGIETGNGSVITQRPGNGATGVSVNASPIVLFVNRALNANTVPSAVHVAQNGQLVTGTVTIVGNGQTIEFTPASPWAYEALIQVFLDATALDVAGNTVTAYQGTFNTVGDPSTTAPAVVNYSPGYNVTGVPVNAVMETSYSEPLSATAVNNTNVYLNGPSGRVTATATLDATGYVVRLVPSAALTASSQYCFYAYYLQGTNGLAAQNLGYCFTTGTAAKTTAPTVVAVSPANRLSGVPVNARISVLFSGPIDTLTVTGTTIQVSGGGQTEVPASISFSNNDQTVEITPEAALPVSTVMSLAISGVTDAAGNAVKAQTTQFTTSASPDLVTTYVIAENPTYQTTNVPLNAFVSIQATAAIDPSTVNSSSLVVYDTVLGTDLNGTYSVSADALTAYFVPSAPLAANRQYNVYFQGKGMADQLGNAISCCTTGTLGNFYFTTGISASTTAPQVTAVSPTNGLKQVPTNTQIVAQFNEPVDAESLSGVTLTTGGAAVPFTASLSNGNQTLTLVPSVALTANATYSLTVAGVTDFSGNPMKAAFTSSFTTGVDPDFSQLVVTSEDPGNGFTNVPLNALVRLGFNKAIDGSAVGVGSVSLYPPGLSGAAHVTGKVVLASDRMSVTMTPSAPLPEETQYCIYVYGFVDDEGGSLAQNGQELNCFTTGTSAVTTAPAVTGFSPTSGAVGVPVNALVQVQLSAQASEVSVGAKSSSITLTSGGVPVAGTVSVFSPTVLTFTPSVPLAVSTSYIVTVGGFTDLAGNAFTGATSSFTTSSSVIVDSGPLTVLSIAPGDGATGVAVTSPVVVTFNEAVNPLTVTNQSVVVQAYVQGAWDTVAGTYAVSGPGVTFTPLNPLPGGATVRVLVDDSVSVQDLAGNSGQYAGVTFTTAATADTTAPTVVSVTPMNKATGIGLNGQVVLTFSKSMNPATLKACCTTGNYSNVAVLAGETRVGFNPSVSADNRTLTLSGLNLPASTVMTVVVTHGATDLSGNALVDFSSRFTTGSGIETGNGSVITQRPGNGATGVSVNASPIVLFVNRALNANTVPSAVHVAQNGQLVTGTVTIVGNGQTIEFTPASPWAYEALIQVFLDATALDVAGNTVTAYQGTFNTVGDPSTTAPAVVNYSPGYNVTGVPVNAVMETSYSEPLSATAVNNTNVYLNGPSGRVTATATLDATGYVVRLVPSAALTASSQYCFYAYYLQGTNGLAAQNLGYCFTTGTAAKTTAPTVVAVSPANRLSGVPVNARISVLFSGPIDTLTVTGTTIQVSGGGQTEVPASISFSNNDQTVEITPEAALPVSTVMSLAISGVTDAAGNAVKAQTTQFTTSASPDLVTTYVIAENPTYQTTNVPLNAFVSIQATAAIDPSTVNSSSLVVYDTVLGTDLNGTYSVSADALTAYFVPSAPLAANRQYNVYFQGKGMADQLGNAISCCTTGTLGNFYFTTGISASTTAPQVTAVSPTNGLKQVPTNTQIVAQFNEPVDAESLSGVTLTTGGAAVPFTASLSNGNQTLTLVPSVALTANATYSLTVAGVTDFSGNPMKAAFTSSFTTGVDPDFSQLVVTKLFRARHSYEAIEDVPFLLLPTD